jgi:hypothetical protein
MTKDHRRGNREFRKPKKQKDAMPVPAALIKDAVVSFKGPEKKSKHAHEYSNH